MKPLASAATAIALATTSAHAVTLLQDTFDSAGATIGDDANDPLDTAWYKADQNAASTSPDLSVATDGSFFSSTSALLVDPTTGSQPFVGAISLVTLANIGDSITLSVKYRQPADTGGGFLLGLYNDGGTPTSTDNDTSTTNDKGYLLNVGTPTGTSNGATAIGKDFNASGELGFSTTLVATFATGIKPDNIVHDISFTIERTALSTLSFTGVFSDPTQAGTVTRTDTSATVFDFNEVFFKWGDGSATPTYYLDDITVTTNVPEPSVSLLGALGALALLRRRR